jgi:diguanylate cyclase (GGDEF)-like protein
MSSRARHRILIVDDNPAIHDDFAKILSPETGGEAALAELEAALFADVPLARTPALDVEIVSAHQGEEAIAIVCDAVARGEPFAVAFVDVRMPPGIDGVETIARMWEVDPHLQAVICTAYSDHSWASMTARLGDGDRFLVLKKPFDSIEVIQLAQALTRKWALARAMAEHLEQLESLVAERTRALERANEELSREVDVRRQAQRELEQLATHDALTGLPNRLLLCDRIAAAVARGRRHGTRAALMVLDLDHFKEVNDTYGHAAGDDVLRETARRLEASVRACDTVARLGGDEFIVLLEDLAAPGDAALVASRIVAACSEPIRSGDHAMRAPPSVGIAICPEDGANTEALLQCADLAMYQAKSAGRGTFRFFDDAMLASSALRVSLRHELEIALREGQLALWYQPLVDLHGGAIRGVEALLRWVHPERGLVAPMTFIPEAERSGLIVPMGEWVLETACQQLAAWRRAHGTNMTVAVNVSARQLESSGFVDAVRRSLAAAQLEPSALELEITESAAFEDEDRSRAVLAQIADLGVRILIDDFGAGFSSLNRLRSLPIDALKIDRMFVRSVATDPADAAIVLAIVGMAHALGIEVVAEGIESAAQLEALRTLRWDEARRPICDRGQGFYLGRPAPAAEAARAIFGDDAPRRAAEAAAGAASCIADAP